jgi:hypothetical protein
MGGAKAYMGDNDAEWVKKNKSSPVGVTTFSQK